MFDYYVLARARSREEIERLIAEQDQPYGIYWRNPDEQAEPACAMVFFTNDGELIVGISDRVRRAVFNRDDEQAETQRAARRLRELAGSMGADYGVILLESPPPDTVASFVQAAHESYGGLVP